MLYPMIVLALALGLAVMVAFFILPRLTDLFKSFDFELPIATRILLAAAAFVSENGAVALGVLLAGTVGAAAVSRLTPVRFVLHTAITYVPFLKDISRDVNLARFCTALASLLASGIPISKALSFAASVMPNYAYRRELQNAISRVDTGDLLSDTLAQGRLYPPFVTRMLLVGETSGRLVEVLEYLGGFYDNELDNRLKNISTVIEPVMLIAIGLFVAFVALSIITPIYGFLSVFD
jgi:type II secretory pathway component PulF